MRYALCATQAPHVSYRNGASAATARQYFLRKTARQNNGPRITPAITGLAPGEMRSVWGDVSGELHAVRNPETNGGYQTLDWTPFAAWDSGTRQIVSAGQRFMRKIKVYSDLTGDWREASMSPGLGRQYTTTGHWWGCTATDGAGNVYLQNVGCWRYQPATEEWTALPAHPVTNGTNGSSMVWIPTLFGGSGGLVKYGGDAKRWLIYNPATNTWPVAVDGLPGGQHAILAYHPTYDKVLMVGGTNTDYTAALVTPSTGAYTVVASCPVTIAMDTSDWMVPHPDGCYLLRSGVAGRLFAYWPSTDTWQDMGVAPDAGLTTPQIAFDSARSTVYIIAAEGLYAYALTVMGPRSGAVVTTDDGDTSQVVGTTNTPTLGVVAVVNAGDVSVVVGSVDPPVALPAQVVSGPFTNPATRQPLPLTLIEHVLILSIASPAIVLAQTNLTTDTSARLTVTNAALAAGTSYLMLAFDATGANVGVKRVTAVAA